MFTSLQIKVQIQTKLAPALADCSARGNRHPPSGTRKRYAQLNIIQKRRVATCTTAPPVHPIPTGRQSAVRPAKSGLHLDYPEQPTCRSIVSAHPLIKLHSPPLRAIATYSTPATPTRWVGGEPGMGRLHPPHAHRKRAPLHAGCTSRARARLKMRWRDRVMRGEPGKAAGRVCAWPAWSSLP